MFALSGNNYLHSNFDSSIPGDLPELALCRHPIHAVDISYRSGQRSSLLEMSNFIDSWIANTANALVLEESGGKHACCPWLSLVVRVGSLARQAQQPKGQDKGEHMNSSRGEHDRLVYERTKLKLRQTNLAFIDTIKNAIITPGHRAGRLYR